MKCSVDCRKKTLLQGKRRKHKPSENRLGIAHQNEESPKEKKDEKEG